MRIITKYMLKELGGPFAGSLLVLTVIVAAGNIIQTVDMVMNKGVDIMAVLRIFLLFLPYVLIFTIPISVLSGVLLGFGRLSGDNELTAVRTSGINLKKIIFPVMVCGLIISLANVPLNDRILPESEFAARKLMRSLGVKNPTALLEPGVFIKGFQDYIIFIHSIEGDTLRNVRIYQPREGEPTRTIVAESGKIVSFPESNSVMLNLRNGTADEISTENPDEFYKLTFKDYQMTLNLEEMEDPSSIQKKAREKSVREIRDELLTIDKGSSRALSLRIELHKKFALAFSNLIFVFVGIPLAITTHRREKFIGFGMAIVIFLLYWGMIMTGIAFAVKGAVPAWLGVWSANIILSLLGAVLFRKLFRR